ncbi:MAG: gephyrin-like molybdotransferase Glp [Planctomycetota bacterium]|nr:gephyrin-like molybdotransferase Glp [Planctomycetota bacterium]
MSTSEPELSASHTDHDVRMRGFARRTTVERALCWVDEQSCPLEPQRIPIDAAYQRVLANDVVSAVDVPGFDRSMMDGYAVRSEDTLGATPYNRLPLRVVGQALPGVAFSEKVVSGQAVRIMTGAPLPAGADAVLPVERIEVDGDRILAQDSVVRQKHVGVRGEDVRSGDSVLPRGRCLRPQDVGVLSSIGQAEVDVIRSPRVRIIVTGNELLPAGSLPSEHRISDANGPMLTSLVTRDGGLPEHPGIVPDNPESILDAMHSDVDVVLVSGGSSVGQEDHAPVLLATHGKLPIHGIAMRPSSPAGMGLLGKRLVFLLPGNPVACLSAYDFFAGRAIRRLSGNATEWPYATIERPLCRKLVSTVGRVDYARVRMNGDTIEPLAISGASLLSTTTRADGFVIIPADSEGYPEGTVVEVFCFDQRPVPLRS